MIQISGLDIRRRADGVLIVTKQDPPPDDQDDGDHDDGPTLVLDEEVQS